MSSISWFRKLTYLPPWMRNRRAKTVVLSVSKERKAAPLNFICDFALWRIVTQTILQNRSSPNLWKIDIQNIYYIISNGYTPIALDIPFWIKININCRDSLTIKWWRHKHGRSDNDTIYCALFRRITISLLLLHLPFHIHEINNDTANGIIIRH